MSFFSDCIDGFYKENCSSECGKCADGKACNKIDGSCENGCSFNFLPPFCHGIFFINLKGNTK